MFDTLKQLYPYGPINVMLHTALIQRCTSVKALLLAFHLENLTYTL